METTTKKWYDKTWLVAVLCIIFFPVGVYALWKSTVIPYAWKVGVSILFGFMILAQISNMNEDKSTVEKEADIVQDVQPVRLSNEEYYKIYTANFDSIKLQNRFKEGGPLYKQYSNQLYAVLSDMQTKDSLFQILSDSKLKKLFDKKLTLTEEAMSNYNKYGEIDEDLVWVTSACEIALSKYLNDPDYDIVKDKYYLKQTSKGYDYKMTIRAKNGFGAKILKELKFSLVFDPASQMYSVTNIN